MINDLSDLDAFLGQYDPGQALVGPLLSLSINSNFRFFHIAGNGAKIYASMGLGFFEAETEAERQRGDIVARLQSRFGEVKVLDNQLEMAREVNRLWPNEETARFFATAALEAKLLPDIASRDESLETRSETGVVPGDHCKQAIEEAPAESVTLADAVDAILSSRASASGPELSASAAAPHGTLNLPDAYEAWPLNADPAVALKSRHAALEQDDVALAVLRLKSPPETDADTGTATAAIANGETTNRPVTDVGRSASTIYRLFAFGGAAALIAGIVVLTSTRPIEKETPSSRSTMRVISADHDSDRSQTTESLTLSNPGNQIANAKDTAPQAGEAPRSSGSVPQSGLSPAASTQNETPLLRPQIGAPHVSQSPSSQIASAQVDGPPTQADAPPVLEPKSRPSAINTQVATAPALADAPASQVPDAPHAQGGSASVSAPQLPSYGAPGSQAAPLPAEPSSNTQNLTRTQSAAAVASQPQTPPSQMASAEGRTPPVSKPELPAAKAASIAKPPLGADELDALLSRGSGFLKTGDFATARILLRRAAESGSAEAALVLGQTFDPLYLNELGAMGIQPDLAQARQWYQKAVELGSDAAAQRLANLAQRGQ